MPADPAAGTVATRMPDPEIIELDDMPSNPVTVTKNQSRLNTFFRRKKETEFVMPEKDAEILKKVKSRAYLLDRGFRICCCNIGIDPIVGLIPVVGDFIGIFLSLITVRMTLAAGLPPSLIYQMYFNVVIDGILGFIPLLGDIADYFYKCNTRNAQLLEKYLIERGRDYTLFHQGKIPAAEFHKRYPEFANSHKENKKNKKHGRSEEEMAKRRSVVVLDQNSKDYGLDYNETPRNT